MLHTLVRIYIKIYITFTFCDRHVGFTISLMAYLEEEQEEGAISSGKTFLEGGTF